MSKKSKRICLHDWRLIKGYSQVELSQELGLSQAEVSQVENGVLVSEYFSRRFKEKFPECWKDVDELQ